MSHHCSECDIGWWPYQTKSGRCPQCGGGTLRSHEAPSEDAAHRHEETIAALDREVLHRRFEAYYAAREERRNAA